MDYEKTLTDALNQPTRKNPRRSARNAGYNEVCAFEEAQLITTSMLVSLLRALVCAQRRGGFKSTQDSDDEEEIPTGDVEVRFIHLHSSSK